MTANDGRAAQMAPKRDTEAECDDPSTAVRVGLIGLGRWGAAHAEALRRLPGARLAAVAVSSEDSARRAEAELGVPAFADWRAMLDGTELDAVDVVAPNALHAEIALVALEAGLHVLVEKPLATTLADCDAIVAAARRSGRVVAVGHELRLSPLWGHVKGLIATGRIGRPLACSVHLWRRSFRLGSAGWRHDPARVGNWILEEPVHFFDLARWYLADLGEPVSVYAKANGRGGELNETLTAIVGFPDGGFASVSQMTAGAEHHARCEVIGRTAALRVIWDGASDRSEQPTYRLELAENDAAHELALGGTPTEPGSLRDLLAQFMRCVTDGEAPVTTAEDGRWAVRLCLAAEESARLGREVAL